MARYTLGVLRQEKRRVATECVSLRGALRDSQEEIASLRGQKIALQVGVVVWLRE